MASELAVKCFPLAGTQDYRVEDFQNYLAMRTTGVYAGTHLQVIAADPAAMAIRVKVGVAWLKFAALQGVSFPLRNETQLDIDAADIALNRIDAIVCGVDTSDNTAYLKVVKGEWAGSPVAPAPVRAGTVYEIVLAHVSVPANTTEIVTGLITDKRSDAALCGLSFTENTVLGEGTYDARPASPSTLAIYFATDTQTLCIYSPTIGEWIEK